MRKKFVSSLTLTLCMATTPAARQAAKPWVTYTPPAKNFTALFPTAPNPDHQITNDGGLVTEVYSYLSGENRVLFFVNCMALNPKATVSADAALKTAQEGLLHTGGAKLLSSTKTEYVRGPDDRLPMLEFTGATDSIAIKGRAIFDTDHMYTVGTFCPKGQYCSSSITKFFSSFKLNSAAPAKLIPAASPAAQQGDQAGVTYTPPSGKLTAQFPAEPKADHQTTKSGNLTSEVYTYTWSDKDVVLIASYMDLDANATPSADEDLKAAQDSLVQGVGGKLLKSTRTEFPRGLNDQLPTLQFTGESDKATIRGAVIYDVYHIYMLLTLCPKDQQCDATTAKFLITFKLNPAGASKANPAPASAPASHSAQPGAQQTSEPWLRYISDEGKFSALFPTQPKPDHKTSQSGDQTIESTTFLVVDNGIVLGASYTDYDPNTTYDVEPGLIAEQNAFLKAVSATLLTSRRTEFPRGTEKLPAMEFTGASDEQTVKGWVIVDVRRVYIVVVQCPKTQDGAAETAKFLSSFKLLAKN